MGKPGEQEHSLLGFPRVLAPLHHAHALFVLTKRGLNRRPAVVGIGHRGGLQVGQGRDQHGVVVATLLLGSPNDPLPRGATEARRVGNDGQLTSRTGRGLPGASTLAQLAHPPTMTDFGDDLIAGPHHPAEHLRGPNAPVQAEDDASLALLCPAETGFDVTEGRFQGWDHRGFAPE